MGTQNTTILKASETHKSITRDLSTRFKGLFSYHSGSYNGLFSTSRFQMTRKKPGNNSDRLEDLKSGLVGENKAGAQPTLQPLNPIHVSIPSTKSFQKPLWGATKKISSRLLRRITEADDSTVSEYFSVAESVDVAVIRRLMLLIR
jgi:hypothetical protein